MEVVEKEMQTGVTLDQLFALVQEVNMRCSRLEASLATLSCGTTTGNTNNSSNSSNSKRRKVEVELPPVPSSGPPFVLTDLVDRIDYAHLQHIFAADYLVGVLKTLVELWSADGDERPICAVGPPGHQQLYIVDPLTADWRLWTEDDYNVFMNAVLRQFRLLFSEWLKRHQQLIDDADEDFVGLWATNSKKLNGGNVSHEQMLIRLRKELCKAVKYVKTTL